MTDELMVALISAITGSFSGGIVNFILEKRKEHREDKKEKEKLKKEIYETRPELDIVEYKDYISRPGYGIKQKCDINIFLAKIKDVSIQGDGVEAQFHEEHFRQEEWCCVIYTFKNNGKTDIQCINPICNNKKTTVLYDVKKTKMGLEYGLLNYSEWFDKKVRIGESFTMKVCYHKDCIIAGMVSALMDMGFQDDNGRYWSQPLFAPYEKIYNASMISHEAYRDALLPNTAIKCFMEPWLW
ncbi:MAG: hypothetical protein IJ455_03935 [Agathobacter sp.]|nr:hypothetical protein [Agathobacter sp.]